MVTQLAVLTNTVGILASAVERLTETLPREYVSNQVWVQRNHLVDNMLGGQGREIGQLRTAIEVNQAKCTADADKIRADLASRRAPWWAVGSVVVAIVSLAWTMFGGPV